MLLGESDSHSPPHGRLLLDEALPGAENMARDEALLDCRTQPTLRFYRWARPTLSLGYFQCAADLPLDEVRDRGCDIVRRSTGGKAILHEHELTYSLCVPEGGAFSRGPSSAMESIHLELALALSEQLGNKVYLRREAALQSDTPNSPWCFEDSSPLDLCLGEHKLLGSAARRRKGWVLFHGSLVIKAPLETPDIAAMSCEPDMEALSLAFSRCVGLPFSKGEWLDLELEAAHDIHAKKYARDGFSFLR